MSASETCPVCRGGGRETSISGWAHDCRACSGWGYVARRVAIEPVVAMPGTREHAALVEAVLYGLRARMVASAIDADMSGADPADLADGQWLDLQARADRFTVTVRRG